MLPGRGSIGRYQSRGRKGAMETANCSMYDGVHDGAEKLLRFGRAGYDALSLVKLIKLMSFLELIKKDNHAITTGLLCFTAICLCD